MVVGMLGPGKLVSTSDSGLQREINSRISTEDVQMLLLINSLPLIVLTLQERHQVGSGQQLLLVAAQSR